MTAVMSELPTGTVTFVFTDIEGSTALLDRLGDGYGEVLFAHHALLRAQGTLLHDVASRRVLERTDSSVLA
jgi:class 3 adenylate cyclase